MVILTIGWNSIKSNISWSLTFLLLVSSEQTTEVCVLDIGKKVTSY